MHHYRAFGFTLSSQYPLFGYSQSKSHARTVADATVRFTNTIVELQTEKPDEILFSSSASEIIFNSPRNGIKCTVSNGNRITVSYGPFSDIEYTKAPLYGAALAALLSQKGNLVLHGTAIQTPSKNVLLLAGQKKAGKTTLALAAIAHNHRLSSDDISAISFGQDNNSIRLLAGVPVIKLWPDALHASTCTFSKHQKIHPNTEKLLCLVPPQKFAEGAGTVSSLFLLDTKNTSSSTYIEQVSNSTQKVLSVISCLYFADFMHLFSKSEKQRILNQCTVLAKNINIYRVIRPSGFDAIPETLAAITSA